MQKYSVFSLLLNENDVYHYSNITDAKGNIIFPSEETPTSLKEETIYNMEYALVLI